MNSYQQQRQAHNTEAEAYRARLRRGAQLIPGLRMQECETAAILGDQLAAGEITQADWDLYVEAMHREGRVRTPKGN